MPPKRLSRHSLVRRVPLMSHGVDDVAGVEGVGHGGDGDVHVAQLLLQEHGHQPRHQLLRHLRRRHQRQRLLLLLHVHPPRLHVWGDEGGLEGVG